MGKTTQKSLATKPSSIVSGLRQVVADSYAVLAQTHICHWNVRGPSFFSLHDAFEVQYTELFAAIDVIAERIRALGSLAPGGLGKLASMAGMEEIEEGVPAQAMGKTPYDCQSKIGEDLVATRNLAGESGDGQTEDLMIARIQVHQKTIWMLNSFRESN